MKNNVRESSDRVPRLSWTIIVEYSSIFVVVPILTFLIGRFVDSIFLLPAFPPFPINLVAGAAVFLFGLAIGIKSTRLLYNTGRGLPWGEVKKQAQSTKLVMTSLFACCRNPMTFGYSLLPCGMGIMLRSLAMTFFIPAIVFAVMIIWLKVWEEPRLEHRFGQDYRDYKERTPFLIPRFKPLIVDLASPVLILLRREKTESLEVERKDHDWEKGSDKRS